LWLTVFAADADSIDASCANWWQFVQQIIYRFYAVHIFALYCICSIHIIIIINDIYKVQASHRY